MDSPLGAGPPPPTAGVVRAAVVIASKGRPLEVADVLGDVACQTRPADWVVLSVPDDASLPPGGAPDGVVVTRASGAAAQRNAGMEAVPDADVVFFFDDDARVRGDYLERALDVFGRHPEVIALSGRVLLDGATGPEVSTADAEAALERSAAAPPGGAAGLSPRKTLYGCNFAYRTGATAQRFDARLPLYSWLEDHDLARRLLREGRLVTAPDCVIVHRGVKSGGRTNHVRLGYSQVMNPAYFHHKGSFPLHLALSEAGRRLAKNLRDAVISPDRAWRRERLRGNAMAVFDVVRRRYTPERILDL